VLAEYNSNKPEYGSINWDSIVVIDINKNDPNHFTTIKTWQELNKKFKDIMLAYEKVYYQKWKVSEE
jgi:hypothetical protein